MEMLHLIGWFTTHHSSTLNFPLSLLVKMITWYDLGRSERGFSPGYSSVHNHACMNCTTTSYEEKWKMTSQECVVSMRFYPLLTLFLCFFFLFCKKRRKLIRNKTDARFTDSWNSDWILFEGNIVRTLLQQLHHLLSISEMAGDLI